ncbi:hypothetical protein D3C71_2161350 [compost metagenome]
MLAHAQPLAERVNVRVLPKAVAGASTRVQTILPAPVAAVPVAVMLQLLVVA